MITKNYLAIKFLWLYFIITFAFSWLFWIPSVLSQQGWVTLPPWLVSFLSSPFNPAAFGPMFSACVLTFVAEGWPGLKKLLQRALQFRLGKTWYLVIFLLFPFLVALSLLLAGLVSGIYPVMEAWVNPLTIPISFFFIMLLGGPLQEEFGWRGYALDRLQASWNALYASMILGILWAAWHLPLFFMLNREYYYQRPIWELFVSVSLVSLLFTWVYNNTRGSLLGALLLHTVFNWSHYLFPTLKTEMGNYFLMALILVTVIIVLVVWGPDRMVRGKRSL